MLIWEHHLGDHGSCETAEAADEVTPPFGLCRRQFDAGVTVTAYLQTFRRKSLATENAQHRPGTNAVARLDSPDRQPPKADTRQLSLNL